MRQSLRNFVHNGAFMVVLPFAKGAEGTTQKEKSWFGEAVGDLASAWWLWAGIIAILGLLGLLYYLQRSKNDD